MYKGHRCRCLDRYKGTCCLTDNAGGHWSYNSGTWAAERTGWRNGERLRPVGPEEVLEVYASNKRGSTNQGGVATGLSTSQSNNKNQAASLVIQPLLSLPTKHNAVKFVHQAEPAPVEHIKVITPEQEPTWKAKAVTDVSPTGPDISHIRMKRDEGATGEQGPIGATGPNGVVTAGTNIGATGPTGPAGVPGPSGETGLKGEKGDTGPVVHVKAAEETEMSVGMVVWNILLTVILVVIIVIVIVIACLMYKRRRTGDSTKVVIPQYSGDNVITAEDKGNCEEIAIETTNNDKDYLKLIDAAVPVPPRPPTRESSHKDEDYLKPEKTTVTKHTEREEGHANYMEMEILQPSPAETSDKRSYINMDQSKTSVKSDVNNQTEYVNKSDVNTEMDYVNVQQSESSPSENHDDGDYSYIE